MLLLLLNYFLFIHFYKCDQLNTLQDSVESRFLQSKTNALTWLTNVLFPSQNPPYFKKHLSYRGCREYFLRPSNQPVNLSDGWLQTNDWFIQNEEGIIEYKGLDTCREPNHMFPFGWLDKRMSTRTSLIKKDFFCKKTIAQTDVQINDASACGLLFRVLGERNYWALLIDNSLLKLSRIKKGEMITLKTFPELPIKRDAWYVLHIQELIKDVKIKAGIYGDISIDYLYRSQEEDEYKENRQGAVGLLASQGNCKFRNIILRGKKWSAEYERLKKKHKGEVLYDMEEIKKLQEGIKEWCPIASLCAKGKYEAVDV